MAQHDFVIDDQNGLSFLADLNDVLSAIVSNNSGDTEPAETYAYQFWADTNSNILKIRNAADNAWLDVFCLTTGKVIGVLLLSGGTLTGPLTLSGDASSALHAVTKQQLDAATALPVGMIFPYSGTTAPAGALALPTAPTNISRTTYAKLFAAIGTTWGAGDGSTTFGMPYLPADQVPVQANANVGTSTVGENLAHIHTMDPAGRFTGGGGGGGGVLFDGSTITQTNSSGGAANLPAGVRVLYCVQYQ